jgi:hypothetical protein
VIIVVLHHTTTAPWPDQPHIKETPKRTCARRAGARRALVHETVYGTPPVSGFRFMPFARTTLGSKQPLLDPNFLAMAAIRWR